MDRREGSSSHGDAGGEREADQKLRSPEKRSPEKRLPQKRDPMALAMEWVAKITTVSLEMVLPGIFGQWLDSKWGTGFLGLSGFALGLVVGMWHLLQMTKTTSNKR